MPEGYASSEVVRNVAQKSINATKTAKIESVDDSQNIRLAEVSYLGKDGQPIQLHTPYGFMHNPPPGSLVIIKTLAGQETRQSGCADDPKNRVQKNLEPGEVAIGNYITEDYIKFDEDGSILIISKSGSYAKLLPNGDIEMQAESGRMKVFNTVIECDDVNHSGKPFLPHVHGGVVAGGDTTGPPA